VGAESLHPIVFSRRAVAFAAGHRPCAECRRGDYNAYRAAWHETHGGTIPYAKDMDSLLHRERTDPSENSLPWRILPDGAFVSTDHGPAVVVGDHLSVWAEADNAYLRRVPRPSAGSAPVLTPPSTVAVLRAGYPVQIDPAAR
jgi:hypothetical protein